MKPQMSMHPLNPELRKSAVDALMADDDETPLPPEPSTQEVDQVDGVDEGATIESETPAEDASSEHAGQGDQDTPGSPGPSDPSASPPERRKYAGRFETVEELEAWAPQVQAWATKEAQEKQQALQELEDARAQLAALQRQAQRKKPFEELTDEELAELEREGRQYGITDLQSLRALHAIVEDKVVPRLREQEESQVHARMQAYIYSHPNYQADRERVAEILGEDKLRLYVPEHWTPAQKEARYKQVLEATFSQAEKERKVRELEQRAAQAEAKATVARANTQRELDTTRELRDAVTSSEASKSQKSAPRTKPPAPRDAGDELLEAREQSKPFWKQKAFRD